MFLFGDLVQQRVKHVFSIVIAKTEPFTADVFRHPSQQAASRPYRVFRLHCHYSLVDLHLSWTQGGLTVPSEVDTDLRIEADP